MRRRGSLVGLALSAVVMLGATAVGAPTTGAGATDAVDLTRLPIGTAITHTPSVGAVDSCQTTFGGGGASGTGPWLNGDGTFDLTAKPHVDGQVDWVSSLSILFGSTGATRIITSNDLPDHPTGTFPIAATDDAYQYDRNPNTIRAQSLRLPVPTRPGLAATPACLGMGSIGIMLSGAAVFNALDAAGRDAVAYEIPDACGGHPQQAGAYHYHAVSSCQDDPADGEHSPLLGYARDGFGIYGHHGEDGETLTNADLDACHGHAHAIEWDGVTRVMYHYHATWEYPYTIGCLRGQSLTTAPTNCNLAPPDNAFTDVAADDPAVDAIDWAACHGLSTGSTFRPAATLKRKQAVLLLWRLLGTPAGAAATAYSDVPAGATYHDALDWATAEGVVAPNASGAFRPTATLPRKQWVRWLWHLLGDPAGDPDVTFTDVPAGAGYHDALDWAVAHDVVVTSGSTFGPGVAVTRREAVAALSALAAADEVWAGYAGTPPDTLRQL